MRVVPNRARSGFSHWQTTFVKLASKGSDMSGQRTWGNKERSLGRRAHSASHDASGRPSIQFQPLNSYLGMAMQCLVAASHQSDPICHYERHDGAAFLTAHRGPWSTQTSPKSRRSRLLSLLPPWVRPFVLSDPFGTISKVNSLLLKSFYVSFIVFHWPGQPWAYFKSKILTF